MIDFSWMSLLIFISVIIFVIVSLLAAYIIYRRDPKSREHQFFAIFFIGLAGYVFFYLFLQDPTLKEMSYIFQLFSISTGILGLFLFYYSLAHEGKIANEMLFACIVSLYLIPLLCIILHPYDFILEWYGYELAVDLWFIMLISVIYLIYGFYAILGMLWVSMKTKNTSLKHRIKLVFIGLIIMSIFGIFLFVIIPLSFNVHHLKPLGYLALTIGILIMTFAFKGEDRKEKKEMN